MKIKTLATLSLFTIMIIALQSCSGTAEWSEEEVIKMINNPQKEDIYFIKESDNQYSTYKLKAFKEFYVFVVNNKIAKNSVKVVTLGRDDKDFDMANPVRHTKDEILQWAKNRKIEGIERSK